MKTLITALTLAITATTASAGPIHKADVADAVTTQIALGAGFVEGNTIIYSAAPTFGQIMAAKVAVRIIAGDDPTVNKLMDGFSYFGAANNVAILAGASNTVAPVVGAAVAAFIVMDKPPHVPPTECEHGEYLVAGRVCIEGE